MESPDTGRLMQRIAKLNAIYVGLPAEKDTDRLLESILVGAKELTNADGGTLYLLTEDRKLRFEIIHTDSLVTWDGPAVRRCRFPPTPLYSAETFPGPDFNLPRLYFPSKPSE